MNRSNLVRILICLLIFFVFNTSKAVGLKIQRVEPANWWVGMRNNLLQILIYGPGIGNANATLQYAGVKLLSTTRPESKNYLILELEIAPNTKPGNFEISLESPQGNAKIPYSLYEKPSRQGRIQGFSAADVIYLIMPDRFSNGDPGNDSPKGMREGADRKSPYGRHGGDLKGISNHLDYLSNLGVTALWINPVQENDMKQSSYHGYAITDLYKIDPRFGSNEDYKGFVDKAQKSGLKVIMDMVANHIGLEHYWMKDMPYKDWVHTHSEYLNTNFRASIVSDPYASKFDSNTMLNGWFDRSMPDLNQANPILGKYLIQNTLWWIAYSGIDGIRMDTWPYPDRFFMSDWVAAIQNEFPGFGLVGEVWVGDVSLSSFFLKGAPTRNGYKPLLPSVTDFPLHDVIARGLNEGPGWNSGLMRIYGQIANDFMFENPNANVTFLDNHDITRFATDVKGDVNKFKMGLTLLLTTRGTPQIYYGNEIMMEGDGSFHPGIRKDFPGGWAGDSADVFSGKNITPKQQDILDFHRKILNWRKKATVIHSGKLKHFVPDDNIYVYFRYNGSEKVMVVINGNDKPKKLNPNRYAEILSETAVLTDALDNRNYGTVSQIEIPAMTARIINVK